MGPRVLLAGLRWRGTLVLAGCALPWCTVDAQQWLVEPALTARTTWTDNAAFEVQGENVSDTILELVPSVSLRGGGKRFRIAGTAALTALTYTRGTQDSRLLPTVDLTANLEAIERFFFVEAGVVARQERENVFAPRPDGAADFNTVTTAQYRLVPSIQGRLAGEVQYRLRSSNSWTDVSGASLGTTGAYLGEHSLRLERAPTPFGWNVELARSDTRYESQVPSQATLDSGRLALLYALTPKVNFGLRGGYEQTNYVLENSSQAIYGAELGWRPTERTDFFSFVERRFFGTGWQVRFAHRMPRVAWNMSWLRDVVSFPQAFLTLPPTNDVAALLDAAFTTRYPDPVQRGRVVADLIARQAIPSSLSTETSLFSQRLSVSTSGNVSIAIIGVRNALALSAYRSKTEDLAGSIFAAFSIGSVNLEQTGVSASLSHQLTTATAVNLTADRVRAKGLGPDQGLDSKQDSLRLLMTRQLAPKSSAYLGARFQHFESNVPGLSTDARERAAFVGLSHRF